LYEKKKKSVTETCKRHVLKYHSIPTLPYAKHISRNVMETNLQKRPAKEIKETCKRDIYEYHSIPTLPYAKHITRDSRENNSIKETCKRGI